MQNQKWIGLMCQIFWIFHIKYQDIFKLLIDNVQLILSSENIGLLYISLLNLYLLYLLLYILLMLLLILDRKIALRIILDTWLCRYLHLQSSIATKIELLFCIKINLRSD